MLVVDINKRLLENYGRGVGELPKYRLVWGGSQREIRTGLFTKHTEAGIYLGEAVKTEEVPKYPMYDRHWILEYVMPNLNNPELQAKISYEPIFVFRDSQGFPLPYDMEVIEKVIYHHQNPAQIKTPSMLEHEFEESKKAEEIATLDFLQHDKVFPDRMYDSVIISVPSNYKAH